MFLTEGGHFGEAGQGGRVKCKEKDACTKELV